MPLEPELPELPLRPDEPLPPLLPLEPDIESLLELPDEPLLELPLLRSSLRSAIVCILRVCDQAALPSIIRRARVWLSRSGATHWTSSRVDRAQLCRDGRGTRPC